MSASKHGKSERLAFPVRGDNIDAALRKLKKSMQKDGVLREMKAKDHFRSAGELRREAEAKARSRRRKAQVKELMKQGIGKEEAKQILKRGGPR